MPRHDRLRNNIKPMQPLFNTQPLARWRHSRITKWWMSMWRSCSFKGRFRPWSIDLLLFSITIRLHLTRRVLKFGQRFVRKRFLMIKIYHIDVSRHLRPCVEQIWRHVAKTKFCAPRRFKWLLFRMCCLRRQIEVYVFVFDLLHSTRHINNDWRRNKINCTENTDRE